MHHDSLYLIGDVHGCFNTLLALIDTLPQNDKATLIFVGRVTTEFGKNSTLS